MNQQAEAHAKQQEGHLTDLEKSLHGSIMRKNLEELIGYFQGSVLDVGCGDGQISRALVAQGSDVLGVDPTDLHIKIAEERGGGATYMLGSATSLPVEDGSQDAVVACLVFEHIDELNFLCILESFLLVNSPL
jgi:ubiquinone/menaquinone biosynthesis C-methylase UbiE